MRYPTASLLFLCLGAVLRADVTPALPFQDHAVLQQGRAIPVWGRAGAGEKVTVTYAGTTSRTATAVASADGRWRVDLPAIPASAQPATLTFVGKNTVKLNDILVGEVWLASGQSNMELGMGGLGGWGFYITNAVAEVAAANYPQIRELKMAPTSAETPQETGKGAWRVCTPATVGDFSAVAYYFARDLHQKLNVPVGIINAAWSGAPIEPFMTPASLAADPNGPGAIKAWKTKTADFPANKARYDAERAAWDEAKAAAAKAGERFNKQGPRFPFGPGHKNVPSGSYNAMIHPLVPYALRGFIWYQGETNAGANQYRTFFPSLIAGWREVFVGGELPFYWVQLASWGANGDPDGLGIPTMREAQTQTLSVPKTGQALAIDIGDSADIHPHNKQDVGHRLALLALHRTYGQKDVVDSGPTFAKVELNAGASGRVRVHFKDVAGGLKNSNAAEKDAVLGFEVAGKDKVFSAATARIENATAGTVLVTAPAGVSAPVYVRYAWRNDPKNTLANTANLPAAPFRTDP